MATDTISLLSRSTLSSSMTITLKAVVALTFICEIWAMSSLWDHERHHGNNVIFPDVYLNRLGYLNNSHGFKLHTRSERKAAISLYQKMNNLKPSGKIDKNTWHLMTQPRCGVPDLGHITEPRSGRRTGEGTQGDQPDSQWSSNSLYWRPSRLTTNLPVDYQLAIFNEAFRRWSKPSLMRVHLGRSDLKPDIDISFNRGEHGDGVKNAFDGRGLLLAHAFPPGRTDLSGDVHFDADEIWTHGKNTSSTSGEKQTRDLLVTSMHEIGHSLGLKHSINENDVMYPVYSKYIQDPRLNTGDIKQLQSLYGVNPRYVRYERSASRGRIKPRKRKWRFRVDRNVPRWCRMGFNDLIMVSQNQGYVFSGVYVYEINDKGIVDGYPQHVGHVFPGAPINPLAVLYVRQTKKIYFFKDDRLWRFTNHTIDPGYPMIPRKRPPEKPQAALAMVNHRGKTMVLLFGEKLMWRWNFYSEEANGRYHMIQTYWKGLPHKLDAAVQWSDGYVYFFRRNKYYKTSPFTKVSLPRYPKFKGSAWLGGDCGSQPK